jgi:uncharacterized protein
LSTSKLTAADVLRRYVDEELPAFCGIENLTVDTKGLFGETPLEIASVRGSEEELVALLDGGADVNAKGEHGFTALHQAASFGHAKLVEHLIERGADSSMRNDWGQTAQELAASNEIKDLLN